MDSSWFDAWTRRRFGLATGSALAWLLGGNAADETDAGVKNRRKRKRSRRRNQNPDSTPNPNQPCPGRDCDTERPDFVVIVVDDMRESDFQAMSRTRAVLAEKGVTYPNFFSSTPQCSPSRASLLVGQYAHNHGVLRNTGADGGWTAFRDSGADEDTIASWLRGAEPAYRTAHIGKYLNEYDSTEGDVAPGWSDWVVPVPVNYYNYTLNVNGVPEPHDRLTRDYLTDALATKARDIIATTPRFTPLFLLFAPKAAHRPATPARRHQGEFANHPLDQSGSFNEPDMADKPGYMQRPPLDETEIAALEVRERLRLESLLAVDEAVESFVDAIREAGRMSKTYIFFISDHGFLLGQHRRVAKQVPYEESIRMPMLVRGPGIPRGQTNDAMVANIDLAPTIARLAGVDRPGGFDGRSFADTFDGAASPRQAMLIEFFAGPELGSEAEVGLLADEIATPPYRAIRTEEYLYVEYQNAEAERELYDLNADPDQMQSRHDDPGFADIAQDLSAWLATLEDCRGRACRTAENSPPSGR